MSIESTPDHTAPPPTLEVGRIDPAERLTLDGTLNLAATTALEALEPPERAAFVLHCVFGTSMRKTARMLGRSQHECRRLIADARRQVGARRPDPGAAARQREEIAQRLANALVRRDAAELSGLLAPDVVMRLDSGGHTRAEPRPITGAEHVVPLLLHLVDGGGDQWRVYPVNGWPGLIGHDGQRVHHVLGFATSADEIVEVELVRDPAVLDALRLPL